MTEHDYPMPARVVGYDEVIQYTDNIVNDIHEYNPDQIIGVARSGMPFATFVSQKLGLDMGYFNPKYEKFSFASNLTPKRIVFVDENFVSGNTQAKIRDFMKVNYPEIEYKLACVMLDMYCPDKDCIHGKFLDFWALDIACFFKPISIEQRGVRYRDE